MINHIVRQIPAPLRTASMPILAASLLVALGNFSVTAQPAPALNLPPLQVIAPATPSCVDVQVEGARSLSYDCLNQSLKADAASQGDAPPNITAKDVTGNGAPTTVGTFSYTGTSIRMGNAFGKSANPQRPPPTSFTSVLLPGGK